MRFKGYRISWKEKTENEIRACEKGHRKRDEKQVKENIENEIKGELKRTEKTGERKHRKQDKSERNGT